MEKNNRKVASAAKQAALTALGERLRAARINAGLTQQKVAERLEVTPQSVRNWEAGRSEPAVEAVDTLVLSQPWDQKGKGGEVWFGRPGC